MGPGYAFPDGDEDVSLSLVYLSFLDVHMHANTHLTSLTCRSDSGSAGAVDPVTKTLGVSEFADRNRPCQCRSGVAMTIVDEDRR